MFSVVAFSRRATISDLVGSSNLAAILNFTTHRIWAEILVVKEPIRELRCHYLVTCVYNNRLLYMVCPHNNYLRYIYKRVYCYMQHDWFLLHTWYSVLGVAIIRILNWNIKCIYFSQFSQLHIWNVYVTPGNLEKNRQKTETSSLWRSLSTSAERSCLKL